MRNSLFGIGIVVVLSACTPAEQTATMTLGDHPTLDGGSFSTGGGITVAADLRMLDGLVALCGVWSESKAQSVLSKGRAGDVMHSGSAYLGDEVLHRDLGFMRKLPPMTSYAGQSAHCVRTGRAWTDAVASQPLSLRLPTQVVHREIGDDGGASVVVRFQQDGPGAFNPSLKSVIFGN